MSEIKPGLIPSCFWELNQKFRMADSKLLFKTIFPPEIALLLMSA